MSSAPVPTHAGIPAHFFLEDDDPDLNALRDAYDCISASKGYDAGAWEDARYALERIASRGKFIAAGQLDPPATKPRPSWWRRLFDQS